MARLDLLVRTRQQYVGLAPLTKPEDRFEQVLENWTISAAGQTRERQRAIWVDQTLNDLQDDRIRRVVMSPKNFDLLRCVRRQSYGDFGT